MNAPMTREQWFALPKKLRRRWWTETDFRRLEPSAELWREIESSLGCALGYPPRKEEKPPRPADHAEHVQAWLNRPGGWLAAHAAQRAWQEEEDNKIMGRADPSPGSE